MMVFSFRLVAIGPQRQDLCTKTWDIQLIELQMTSVQSISGPVSGLLSGYRTWVSCRSSHGGTNGIVDIGGVEEAQNRSSRVSPDMCGCHGVRLWLRQGKLKVAYCMRCRMRSYGKTSRVKLPGNDPIEHLAIRPTRLLPGHLPV
jgi:hypothetical protein